MRALQQAHRFADRLGIGFRARAIGTMALRGRFAIRRLVDQDIFRQINHHRAGTAGFRDVKSFMHHARQVFGFLDQIIMLGRGAGDAGGIGFLEGIIADQMRRHLARQADHRDGIHQRIHQARHGIGSAGAGCHQHHANLAGGTRIAFRRMHRRLFVAHQDVANGVLLENRVIDRQHRAAGVAENHLNAVILQRAQYDLGTRHGQGIRGGRGLGRGRHG